MGIVLDFNINDNSAGVIRNINNNLNSLNGGLNSAVRGSSELTKSLLGIGATAGGIYGIASAFDFVVKEGIKLNKTLEDSTNGVAVLISANSQLASGGVDNYQRFNIALTQSAEIMKQIKTASIDTVATFPQLAQIFQQAIGGALGMGDAMGKNLDEAIKNTIILSQRMSNIAGAIGMPMQFVGEEIRSITEGTITMDSRIAKMLHITNEEIKQAKTETEGFVKLINEKLGSFDPLKDTNTFSKSVARLQDTIDNLRLDITKPIFQDLTGAIDEVTGIIKNNTSGWKDGFNDFYEQTKENTSLFMSILNETFTLIDLSPIQSEYATTQEATDTFMQGFATALAHGTEITNQFVNLINLSIQTIPASFDYVVNQVGVAISFLEKNFYSVISTVGKISTAVNGFLGFDTSEATKELADLSMKINVASKSQELFSQKADSSMTKVANAYKQFEAGSKGKAFLGIFGTTEEIENYHKAIETKTTKIVDTLTGKTLEAKKKTAEAIKGVSFDIDYTNLTKGSSTLDSYFNDIPNKAKTSVDLATKEFNALNFDTMATNLKNGTEKLQDKLIFKPKVDQQAIDDVTNKIATAGLRGVDRQIKETNLKYDELVKKNKGNADLVIQIEQARASEIAKIKEEEAIKGQSVQDRALKQQQKFAEDWRNTQQTLGLAGLKDMDRELAEVNNKFDDMASKYQGHNDKLKQIEEARAKEVSSIRAKYNQKDLEEAQKLAEEFAKLQADFSLIGVDGVDRDLKQVEGKYKEYFDKYKNNIEYIKQIEVAKAKEVAEIKDSYAKEDLDNQLSFWSEYYDSIGDKETGWQIERYKLIEDWSKKGIDTQSQAFQEYLSKQEADFKDSVDFLGSLFEELADSIKDNFLDLLSGDFKGFGKQLEKSFKSTISNMAFDTLFPQSGKGGATNLIGNITGGVSSLFGGTKTTPTANQQTQSSGSSATGLLSNISNISSLAKIPSILSGGFSGITAQIGTSITSLGTTLGSSSMTMFGAGMTGSTMGVTGLTGSAGMGAMAGGILTTMMPYVALGTAIYGLYKMGWGKSRLVESGFKIEEDIKGFWDKENQKIESYQLWSKKTAFKTKKTEKFGDLKGSEANYISDTFSTFQDLLDKLDDGMVELKAGKYTFQSFSEAISKSFLEQLTERSADDETFKEVYKSFSDYAKEQKIKVDEAIAKVFGELNTKIDTAVTSQWNLRGISSLGSANQLGNLKSGVESLAGAFDGLNLDNLTLDNLIAYKDQLFKLDDLTPQMIEKYGGLVEAEQKLIETSVALTKNLLAQGLANTSVGKLHGIDTSSFSLDTQNKVTSIFVDLKSGAIDSSEAFKLLKSTLGLSNEETLLMIDSMKNLDIATMGGVLGLNNITDIIQLIGNSTGIPQSSIDKYKNAGDLIAEMGVSAENYGIIMGKIMERLMTGAEITSDWLNETIKPYTDKKITNTELTATPKASTKATFSSTGISSYLDNYFKSESEKTQNILNSFGLTSSSSREDVQNFIEGLNGLNIDQINEKLGTSYASLDDFNNGLDVATQTIANQTSETDNFWKDFSKKILPEKEAKQQALAPFANLGITENSTQLQLNTKLLGLQGKTLADVNAELGTSYQTWGEFESDVSNAGQYLVDTTKAVKDTIVFITEEGRKAIDTNQTALSNVFQNIERLTNPKEGALTKNTALSALGLEQGTTKAQYIAFLENAKKVLNTTKTVFENGKFMGNEFTDLANLNKLLGTSFTSWERFNEAINTVSGSYEDTSDSAKNLDSALSSLSNAVADVIGSSKQFSIFVDEKTKVDSAKGFVGELGISTQTLADYRGSLNSFIKDNFIEGAWADGILTQDELNKNSKLTADEIDKLNIALPLVTNNFKQMNDTLSSSIGNLSKTFENLNGSVNQYSIFAGEQFKSDRAKSQLNKVGISTITASSLISSTQGFISRNFNKGAWLDGVLSLDELKSTSTLTAKEIDNLNLYLTQATNDFSQLKNTLVSSIDNIQKTIDSLDATTPTLNDVLTAIDGLSSITDSNELSKSIEAIQSNIEAIFNDRKEALDKEKALVESLKGVYDDINSYIDTLNNKTTTKEDIVSQVAKIAGLSGDELVTESGKMREMVQSYYDAELAKLDEQQKTIDDLKEYTKELLYGEKSYLSSRQKANFAELGMNKTNELLSQAVKSGDTANIEKYTNLTKDYSNILLENSKSFGMQNYNSLFNDIVANNADFVKKIDPNANVEGLKKALKDEVVGYLTETNAILVDKQPLIEQNTKSIDDFYKYEYKQLEKEKKQLYIDLNNQLKTNFNTNFGTLSGQTYQMGVVLDTGFKYLGDAFTNGFATVGATIEAYKSQIASLQQQSTEAQRIDLGNNREYSPTEGGVWTRYEDPNMGWVETFQAGATYSSGGFTPKIGIDEIAGVVHGGEYVAPAKQLKKYPMLFEALEKDRRGFKDGGFVGNKTISLQNETSTANLEIKINRLENKLDELIELIKAQNTILKQNQLRDDRYRGERGLRVQAV